MDIEKFRHRLKPFKGDYLMFDATLEEIVAIKNQISVGEWNSATTIGRAADEKVLALFGTIAIRPLDKDVYLQADREAWTRFLAQILPE
jgi:hypothetical protein